MLLFFHPNTLSSPLGDLTSCCCGVCDSAILSQLLMGDPQEGMTKCWMAWRELDKDKLPLEKEKV